MTDLLPPRRPSNGAPAPDETGSGSSCASTASAPSVPSLLPVLGPATRLLWRGADSVQLDLGGRAVVVDGLSREVIGTVCTPSTAPDWRTGPPCPTVAPAERRVLETLTRSGHLWARTENGDVSHVPPAPRLVAELTALAARHGEMAAHVLDARHHATVMVHGDNRAAAHLAALLAASGVGRVHCLARGPARLAHAVPGGVTPADEGHDLDVAAAAAIRRAAPEVDTRVTRVGDEPDLTILAVDEPVDGDRRLALHATGAAHLAVRLGPGHGVVGPLVIPGLTSCLRCADLHRRDRDPTWPALAVQLTVPNRYGPASGAALSTTVVGLAAAQALAFLDGEEPGCIDGTLEVRPPDWRVRRRSWPLHPECGCDRTEE